MWRHGDILLEEIDQLPFGVVKLKHRNLAISLNTGHKHRILEKRVARLYRYHNELVLEVFGESASLVHPEHNSIVLKPGIYRVWRQRELHNGFIQNVFD